MRSLRKYLISLGKMIPNFGLLDPSASIPDGERIGLETQRVTIRPQKMID